MQFLKEVYDLLQGLEQIWVLEVGSQHLNVFPRQFENDFVYVLPHQDLSPAHLYFLFIGYTTLSPVHRMSDLL